MGYKYLPPISFLSSTQLIHVRSPTSFKMLSLLLLTTLASSISAQSTANSSQTITPSGNSTLSVLPSNSISVGASCACALLTASFPTLVLTNTSSNYSTENVDFWDVRSADFSPACMFLPEDAQMVADGVKILAGCGAQFAVRGGGHMNVSSPSWFAEISKNRQLTTNSSQVQTISTMVSCSPLARLLS